MRAATPLGNAAGGQNYGRNYTYKNMFFIKYLVLVLLFLWLINCSSFGYISESFHLPYAIDSDESFEFCCPSGCLPREPVGALITCSLITICLEKDTQNHSPSITSAL